MSHSTSLCIALALFALPGCGSGSSAEATRGGECSSRFASPQGDALRSSTDGESADIPYFIESSNVGGESRVWIGVSDLAEGDTDVTLYFGNPALPPASSAQQTFLFRRLGDMLDPERWVIDGGPRTVRVCVGRMSGLRNLNAAG